MLGRADGLGVDFNTSYMIKMGGEGYREKAAAAVRVDEVCWFSDGCCAVRREDGVSYIVEKRDED